MEKWPSDIQYLKYLFFSLYLHVQYLHDFSNFLPLFLTGVHSCWIVCTRMKQDDWIFWSILRKQTKNNTNKHQTIVGILCTYMYIKTPRLYANIPVNISDIYTLIDGFAYNTCRYFVSCVVFFRAGQRKMQAMRKMSACIIHVCKTID